MDLRKIIKFGKSSYVVSLPKSWLEKNKLEKGDVVNLEEVDNNIVMIPSSLNRKKTLLSTELDVSKLEIRDIKRRIISAYIQNYNVIHIFGKNLKEKSKGIKDAIQNIMALEVMEETTDKIVAKDFLRIEELSLLDLLKRMDIITRAMYLDMMKISEEDFVESIVNRDHDVNRLSFLMYRSIQYYLENPSFAKEKNFSSKKLITYSSAVRNVERVADNCKRIAKLIVKVKLSKKEFEQLKKLLNTVYIVYEEIMKALYKDDLEKAFALANKKRDLMVEIIEFNDKYWDRKYLSQIVEKIKDTLECCHSIGRDLYH